MAGADGPREGDLDGNQEREVMGRWIIQGHICPSTDFGFYYKGDGKI